MSKKILVTQMELLNYLCKCNASDINLSLGECRLLGCLITYANAENNYEAFPGGKTLTDHTGLSIKSIEKFRKSLYAAGWVKIVSGRGWGNSNRYYINAAKIVEAYNKSNKPVKFDSDGIGRIFKETESKPSQHKRNTSGLNRGNVKPYSKPVESTYDFDDDLKVPF